MNLLLDTSLFDRNSIDEIFPTLIRQSVISEQNHNVIKAPSILGSVIQRHGIPRHITEISVQWFDAAYSVGAFSHSVNDDSNTVGSQSVKYIFNLLSNFFKNVPDCGIILIESLFSVCINLFSLKIYDFFTESTRIFGSFFTE